MSELFNLTKKTFSRIRIDRICARGREPKVGSRPVDALYAGVKLVGGGVPHHASDTRSEGWLNEGRSLVGIDINSQVAVYQPAMRIPARSLKIPSRDDFQPKNYHDAAPETNVLPGR